MEREDPRGSAGAVALRALLVEDDLRLASLTAEYLQSRGVAVTCASDGETGLELARRGGFDIVLLDVMLPGRDGLQVTRALRLFSHVPILMLTARGEEADRVLGLELGADDYLAKPFSPRELLARMQALVRRARGLAGPEAKVVRVGGLHIDPSTLTATLEGRPIELTAYELALLRALAERPGRVLGREQLIELAGGSADESFDRSIDVHISRLRQKLGDDARRPRLIKTVRGAGYVLAASGVDP